jgi:hypothetical protein
MIRPENFRAQKFFVPDFFGCKILRPGFFWMQNFLVRKFLGQKIVRAGKMLGLVDCRLPFLIERLVQRT